jgi:hypothetical protein
VQNQRARAATEGCVDDAVTPVGLEGGTWNQRYLLASWSLISWPPELWKVNYYCLSYPDYGILL